MTVVGCARVSPLERDLCLRHDALTAAGACKWFTDLASGATAQRPQLTVCLDHLHADDTHAVWSIDRLGRSLGELTRIVNDLPDRGIQFRSTMRGAFGPPYTSTALAVWQR